MVKPAVTEPMMISKGPREHPRLFRRGVFHRLRSRSREIGLGDDNRLIDIHVLGLVHGTAQDTGDEKRSEEG